MSQPNARSMAANYCPAHSKTFAWTALGGVRSRRHYIRQFFWFDFLMLRSSVKRACKCRMSMSSRSDLTLTHTAFRHFLFRMTDDDGVWPDRAVYRNGWWPALVSWCDSNV